MQFYCGIDLSSRSSQVCVVDEKISVLVQQKAPNELPCIIELVLSCKNPRNNSDPVFCVGANLFAHVSTDRYCGFPLSRE